MTARFSMHALTLCACSCLLSVPAIRAQEKKDDKPQPPAVKLVVPLAVARQAHAKLTARGVKLDEATEIKTGHDKAHAKLLSKGKASAVNMVEPGVVGDTQVELELTLDEGFSESRLPLTLVMPSGAASTSVVLVDPAALVEVKEPHNGFANALPIEAKKIALGAIEKPKDVDVFRIELAAAQKLTAEVHAAREGSPLDAMLSLYSVERRLVAQNDDQPDQRDSRIEFTAPAAGIYFLSLIDANDQGSPLHVYRLTLQVD